MNPSMISTSDHSFGSYDLSIQCQKKPEVMERVLRVVRHRGFCLEALSMNSSDCGTQVRADLIISGERPLEQLTSQIEKLYDVLNVYSETQSAVAVKQI